MAMSLNGMIAGKGGNEEFLSDVNWETFSALVKDHGCFIAGRKSYETVQKWPDYNYDGIEADLKIIVSNDKDLKLEKPYVQASSPKEAIERAKAGNFESVILCGGSSLNMSFLRENLIDEVILNIEPVFVGSGVPIFAEAEFEKRLSLVDVTELAAGIIQIRYSVNPTNG